MRLADTKKQFYFWLTWAAVAIGGSGIWTMHFVGMQSLSLADRAIAYVSPSFSYFQHLLLPSNNTIGMIFI